jgi:hypothetical protein
MSSQQRLTLSSIILTHMAMKTVMVSNHTRADYEYDYVQINRVSEDVIARYSSSLIQRFKVRGETPEECEEWIVRTYVALKYLLGASVLLSSAQFAIRTNLRIVQPYLLYYALFNSSRALMLVTPEHLWKDGKILDETTHAKTQAVTHDICAVDNPLARSVVDQVGFKKVIEGGLGSEGEEYLAFRLHSFPAPKGAAAIWGSESTNVVSTDNAEMPAYKALEKDISDQCGITMLAGKAVGASFVGIYLSTLMIAELLRDLHSGARIS